MCSAPTNDEVASKRTVCLDDVAGGPVRQKWPSLLESSRVSLAPNGGTWPPTMSQPFNRPSERPAPVAWPASCVCVRVVWGSEIGGRCWVTPLHNGHRAGAGQPPECTSSYTMAWHACEEHLPLSAERRKGRPTRRQD